MEKLLGLSIYDKEDLIVLLEDELLDDFEEGFMQGYLAG
tara:strand:+ start:1378 stop:1494 length:117 start_codon:yes stop_codon:yes gene_type:complete